MNTVETDPAEFAERLYTTDDLAAMMGVSKRTVQRLIAEGEVDYRRVGHSVRFTHADYLAALERCRVPARR